MSAKGRERFDSVEALYAHVQELLGARRDTDLSFYAPDETRKKQVALPNGSSYLSIPMHRTSPNGAYKEVRNAIEELEEPVRVRLLSELDRITRQK